MNPQKHTVLIIGASGFIGNTIYRDLCNYFDTYGTYFSSKNNFGNNQQFFHFDVSKGGIAEILNTVNPSVIISSLKGDYAAQLKTHREIATWVSQHHYARLLFLSSMDVFNARKDFPSYEKDSPKSNTKGGMFKISVERMLLETIPAQTAILRLPLVFGNNSPRITELRDAVRFNTNYEIFPNLIISVTTADKIAQQLHYIIATNDDGIFHLASEDVIHHNDFITEICEKTTGKFPIFKNVYDRNDESYLAILPKFKKLPEHYNITVSDVVDNCILEDIVTLKT
ncbi:hypothetical protein ULMS_17880 [Patiriisocius marinistellae]|uniref:dTDP-4-dehydrorhamnose reductase n=1 Tax=Patiriisocius marinistellae TaxID=2494560 RepID=A0A5J4FW16_9FLAO|nr:sugar nucleotide-binding protein [Patiriisocius marinistellae]GEQ86280.1 hypothetical protein ULMS_17880 [Patiriisocius marinistellae]